MEDAKRRKEIKSNSSSAKTQKDDTQIAEFVSKLIRIRITEE